MIFVYGSVNTDIVVFTERFVKEKETIFGENYIINQGGKGANQAVAISKLASGTVLNKNSMFIGRVGNDDFKVFIEKSLSEFGVNKFLVVDDNVKTGIALIEVNGEGENRIVVIPGANFKTGDEEFNYLKSQIKENDILLLQGEIDIKQNILVSKLAQSQGAVVIFDPAPVNEKMIKIFPYIDFFTPNEVEFESLFKFLITDILENSYHYKNLNITVEELMKRIDEIKQIEKMKIVNKYIEDNFNNLLLLLNKKCEIFLKCGVKNIVVKLGSNGVFFKNKNFSFYQNGMKVNAIDTTAAGDNFNGGFAFIYDLLFDEINSVNFYSDKIINNKISNNKINNKIKSEKIKNKEKYNIGESIFELYERIIKILGKIKEIETFELTDNKEYIKLNQNDIKFDFDIISNNKNSINNKSVINNKNYVNIKNMINTKNVIKSKNAINNKDNINSKNTKNSKNGINSKIAMINICKFAQIVAAISVTRKGAAISSVRLEDIETYLNLK